MIDWDHRYQRNENFVFRRFGDETILVPIKDNVGNMDCIYNLNELGAFVWEQLDGKTELEAIIDKILEEYEVSLNNAQADLSEFMTDLIEIEAVIRIR